MNCFDDGLIYRIADYDDTDADDIDADENSTTLYVYNKDLEELILYTYSNANFTRMWVYDNYIILFESMNHEIWLLPKKKIIANKDFKDISISKDILELRTLHIQDIVMIQNKLLIAASNKLINKLIYYDIDKKEVSKYNETIGCMCVMNNKVYAISPGRAFGGLYQIDHGKMSLIDTLWDVFDDNTEDIIGDKMVSTNNHLIFCAGVYEDGNFRSRNVCVKNMNTKDLYTIHTTEYKDCDICACNGYVGILDDTQIRICDLLRKDVHTIDLQVTAQEIIYVSNEFVYLATKESLHKTKINSDVEITGESKRDQELAEGARNAIDLTNPLAPQAPQAPVTPHRPTVSSGSSVSSGSPSSPRSPYILLDLSDQAPDQAPDTTSTPSIFLYTKPYRNIKPKIQYEVINTFDKNVNAQFQINVMKEFQRYTQRNVQAEYAVEALRFKQRNAALKAAPDDQNIYLFMMCRAKDITPGDYTIENQLQSYKKGKNVYTYCKQAIDNLRGKHKLVVYDSRVSDDFEDSENVEVCPSITNYEKFQSALTVTARQGKIALVYISAHGNDEGRMVIDPNPENHDKKLQIFGDVLAMCCTEDCQIFLNSCSAAKRDAFTLSNRLDNIVLATPIPITTGKVLHRFRIANDRLYFNVYYKNSIHAYYRNWWTFTLAVRTMENNDYIFDKLNETERETNIVLKSIDSYLYEIAGQTFYYDILNSDNLDTLIKKAKAYFKKYINKKTPGYVKGTVKRIIVMTLIHYIIDAESFIEEHSEEIPYNEDNVLLYKISKNGLQSVIPLLKPIAEEFVLAEYFVNFIQNQLKERAAVYLIKHNFNTKKYTGTNPFLKLNDFSAENIKEIIKGYHLINRRKTLSYIAEAIVAHAKRYFRDKSQDDTMNPLVKYLKENGFTSIDIDTARAFMKPYLTDGDNYMSFYMDWILPRKRPRSDGSDSGSDNGPERKRSANLVGNFVRLRF